MSVGCGDGTMFVRCVMIVVVIVVVTVVVVTVVVGVYDFVDSIHNHPIHSSCSLI